METLLPLILMAGLYYAGRICVWCDSNKEPESYFAHRKYLKV